MSKILTKKLIKWIIMHDPIIFYILCVKFEACNILNYWGWPSFLPVDTPQLSKVSLLM